MATASTEALLKIPISESVPMTSIEPLLASPPWHHIQGSFNFRHVTCEPLVKERLIFRSGSLAGITDDGRKGIEALGIKAVFDLRSKEERDEAPEPTFEHAQGIWTEMGQVEGGLQLDMEYWCSLEDYYFSILSTHRGILQEIFRHVLHHPNEPFLVHCTVGKDRTAVAVALMLRLAGVPDAAIAREYALSRIGLEPARAQLEAKLAGGDGESLDWHRGNAIMMASCRVDVMERFLRNFDEAYEGGVEGYVSGQLHFTGSEILSIRKNLLVDSAFGSKA